MRKAEKDLLQEQDVFGRVPSILKAALVIGKHGKLMDFSVVLTLSGRQVLLSFPCASQRSNSDSSFFHTYVTKVSFVKF